MIIRFDVMQTWKQDLEKFVTVKEFHGNTEGFEPNAEWLLYAFRNADGTFRIARGCCLRTYPLSVATKQGDFKAFKKMRLKPKQILESK